jgi:hypothetical protein
MGWIYTVGNRVSDYLRIVCIASPVRYDNDLHHDPGVLTGITDRGWNHGEAAEPVYGSRFSLITVRPFSVTERPNVDGGLEMGPRISAETRCEHLSNIKVRYCFNGAHRM